MITVSIPHPTKKYSIPHLLNPSLPTLRRFPRHTLELPAPHIVLELRNLHIEGIQLLVDLLKFCSLLLLVALAGTARALALVVILGLSSDASLGEGRLELGELRALGHFV